jgi:hypothetical protein
MKYLIAAVVKSFRKGAIYCFHFFLPTTAIRLCHRNSLFLTRSQPIQDQRLHYPV